MWPKRLFLCTLGLALLVTGRSCPAEYGLLGRYRERLAATQLEQPHWATPLVTTAPRLEQGFRINFIRQSLTGGQTGWNYGNAKGLQFVPFRHIELQFSPPPFFTHTNRTLEDGFGDVAFRMKYRFYGSSEEHYNAIVTGLLSASVPTGKSGNGSTSAVLSPTLELGKGVWKLEVTTSIGGSLPVSNTLKLGRQVVWNTAAQYHATKLLWLETEISSTFYKGGKNDGREQTFATPGLVVSRIPLVHRKDGKGDVLLLSLGMGEQIALTHFSTYNHSPIFSARLRF